jgi:serine/threonine-protein kinase RIO1
MKIPKRLQPLVDDGLIEAVESQLMSGKEAQVYVVRSHGERRCTKVRRASSPAASSMTPLPWMSTT